MALLEVTDLHKHFGALAAVDGVSLTVEPGEAYGLVGPDGAGKTTAIRMMVGALSLEAGQVRILGHDLRGHAEEARACIGYLAQRFSLYGDLTVYENLAFFGSVRGLERQVMEGRAHELLGFVGLAGFEDRLAGALSGGMKQKLGLACALIHRPPLLLLDEPTGGVDPVTRQDFWQLIIRLLAEGTGVVVTTPYMDEAVRCSRLGFMYAGRLLTTGSPRELMSLLTGRVLELKAQPKALARRICQADPDVEDVAAFGELLHLRLGTAASEVAYGAEAGGVLARLPAALAAAGVQVHALRPVAPSLEDAYISLLQTGGHAISPRWRQHPSGRRRWRVIDVAVQVEQLVKRFGDFTAVDGISFEVHTGEVVGYLGPNGSGKTTTIRMLLGLLRPTAGRAQVLGFDAQRETEAIRPLVGYMSQKFSLYDELTMAENLEFYAGIYGLSRADRRLRQREVLDLVGLSGRQDERAGQVSGGWRQRLALAIALVHRPRLLFLDEPTSGVDPAARRVFWDLIDDLAEAGTTVFVSTHFMDEAEYCGRLGIMSAGRLLAMDSPSALKRDTLPGPAWNLLVDRLIPALDALQRVPGVLQVGLRGDHLHAITRAGQHTAASLQSSLQGLGFMAQVEPADPTLEDVFLTLAGHGVESKG